MCRIRSFHATESWFLTSCGGVVNQRKCFSASGETRGFCLTCLELFTSVFTVLDLILLSVPLLSLGRPPGRSPLSLWIIVCFLFFRLDVASLQPELFYSQNTATNNKKMNSFLVTEREIQAPLSKNIDKITQSV